MPERSQYDVVITGGGLAGLTLARQLRQTLPDLSLLVIEKHPFPVREAAFKVGESSVEIGAHYFGHVLGLRPYLEQAHLPKNGIRYFFTRHGNRDLGQRAELGPRFPAEVPSWQLDRGRLENSLAEMNRLDGIEVADASRVISLEMNAVSGHRVTFERAGQQSTVRGRWLVDASGRGGLLKRHLGLARAVDHNSNAAWFRVPYQIRIDDWVSGADWAAFVPSRTRWLSTNHLMGRGYWVWLIPLGSGSTSVGIVADDVLHPLATYNRYERAIEWLERYEPQVADVVTASNEPADDFLVLRHYAHGCQRVYSSERWCLTGEAGAFTDPLYSPGSDFIGMSNDFIVDLIRRELRGEPIDAVAEQYNRTYLLLFSAFLRIYSGQYRMMGNAQVMSAKILWDNACYWAIPALIFFRRKFTDPVFLKAIDPLMQRFFFLHHRMQTMVRKWDEAVEPPAGDARNDILSVDLLREWHRSLPQPIPDDAELVQRLTANLERLEVLASALTCLARETEPGSPVVAECLDQLRRSILVPDSLAAVSLAGLG